MKIKTTGRSTASHLYKFEGPWIVNPLSDLLKFDNSMVSIDDPHVIIMRIANATIQEI